MKEKVDILFERQAEDVPIGMGADEILIHDILAKFGHDPDKKRNHRQRYRYDRLARYTLNKYRMQAQGIRIGIEWWLKYYCKN